MRTHKCRTMKNGVVLSGRSNPPLGPCDPLPRRPLRVQVDVLAHQFAEGELAAAAVGGHLAAPSEQAEAWQRGDPQPPQQRVGAGVQVVGGRRKASLCVCGGVRGVTAVGARRPARASVGAERTKMPAGHLAAARAAMPAPRFRACAWYDSANCAKVGLNALQGPHLLVWRVWGVSAHTLLSRSSETATRQVAPHSSTTSLSPAVDASNASNSPSLVNLGRGVSGLSGRGRLPPVSGPCLCDIRLGGRLGNRGGVARAARPGALQNRRPGRVRRTQVGQHDDCKNHDDVGRSHQIPDRAGGRMGMNDTEPKNGTSCPPECSRPFSRG